MKTKQLSPEKLRKIQLRKEKELKYWEKQKARPKGNTYFWYLILIIALIYAVDEIASQINSLMQTEIANDFIQSESSVTILNLLNIVAIPFQVLYFYPTILICECSYRAVAQSHSFNGLTNVKAYAAVTEKSQNICNKAWEKV